MKKSLLTTAALVTLAGSAFGADIAAAPYGKAPMVSPAYNWTGFYIGAMGGYGWSDRVTSGNATIATNDIKGGFGGGTIGYNWQTPGSQFVWGLEADAAWSDLKYSEPLFFGLTFQDKIRSFGSVTGRAGFAVDAALFYVKGGYAWADNRMAITGGGATLFSESKVHSGWTVGGGVEYGFAQNWSIKGEYMFASYSEENYLSTFTAGGINLGLDVHTVKGGLNYRFGGPVVARY
jgi:outer membrane immunogenic protein